MSPVFPMLNGDVTSKLLSVMTLHCPKSLSNLKPKVLLEKIWSTSCVLTSDSIVWATLGFISTNCAPVGISSFNNTGPVLSSFIKVPFPVTFTTFTHLYVVAFK